MGPFPAYIPGQMVDEIQPISSSQVAIINLTTVGSGYTVPAGYTLLIHGINLQLNSLSNTGALLGLILGGVSVATLNITQVGVGNPLVFADRYKLLLSGGTSIANSTFSMGIGPLASTAQTTAANNYIVQPILQQTTAIAMVLENASYLFWPVPSGQIVSVSYITGSSGASVSGWVWGTLHPN